MIKGAWGLCLLLVFISNEMRSEFVPTEFISRRSMRSEQNDSSNSQKEARPNYFTPALVVGDMLSEQVYAHIGGMTALQQSKELTELMWGELKTFYPELQREKCETFLQMLADPTLTPVAPVMLSDIKQLDMFIAIWNKHFSDSSGFAFRQQDFATPPGAVPLFKLMVTMDGNFFDRTQLPVLISEVIAKYGENPVVLNRLIELLTTRISENDQKKIVESKVTPPWLIGLLENEKLFVNLEANDLSKRSGDFAKIKDNLAKNFPAGEKLYLPLFQKMRVAKLEKDFAGVERCLQQLLSMNCDNASMTKFLREKLNLSRSSLRDFAFNMIRRHQKGSLMAVRGVELLWNLSVDDNFIAQYTFAAGDGSLFQNLEAAIRQLRLDGYKNVGGWLNLDEFELISAIICCQTDKLAALSQSVRGEDLQQRRNNYQRKNAPAINNMPLFWNFDLITCAQALQSSCAANLILAQSLAGNGDMDGALEQLSQIINNEKSSAAIQNIAYKLYYGEYFRRVGILKYNYLGCDNLLLAVDYASIYWRKADIETILADFKKLTEFYRLQGKLNSQNNSGGVLHNMVGANNLDLEFFKVYLAAKPDMNMKNFSQQTPLEASVRNKNFVVAELLMNSGADLNATDAEGKNILFGLIFYKATPDCVANFIKHGANVNSVNKYGQNVLFSAIESKNYPMVDLLVEQGADVNQISNERGTPLCCALNIPEYPLEEIKKLLMAGADPNLYSPRGLAPLALALDRDDPAFVKLLLEYKLELNKLPILSNNHLFRTILMNDLAKTKQLLTLGADPNVTDEDGLTPLIYGVNSNRSNALAIVEVLLEAGANINYKLPTVNPPLIQAADCHNMPMVKLLVAKQADVNLLDKDNLNIMDYGLIHKFQPLIDFCESINLAPNRPDLSKD